MGLVKSQAQKKLNMIVACLVNKIVNIVLCDCQVTVRTTIATIDTSDTAEHCEQQEIKLIEPDCVEE